MNYFLNGDDLIEEKIYKKKKRNKCNLSHFYNLLDDLVYKEK
jgi:hypothetical protein